MKEEDGKMRNNTEQKMPKANLHRPSLKAEGSPFCAGRPSPFFGQKRRTTIVKISKKFPSQN